MDVVRPALVTTAAIMAPITSSFGISTVGRSADNWPFSKAASAAARAVRAASEPCSMEVAASARAFLASLMPAPSMAS
ncbi:hypothetical protein D3C81_1867330 [compost metagenome]